MSLFMIGKLVVLNNQSLPTETLFIFLRHLIYGTHNHVSMLRNLTHLNRSLMLSIVSRLLN